MNERVNGTHACPKPSCHMFMSDLMDATRKGPSASAGDVEEEDDEEEDEEEEEGRAASTLNPSLGAWLYCRRKVLASQGPFIHSPVGRTRHRLKPPSVS